MEDAVRFEGYSFIVFGRSEAKGSARAVNLVKSLCRDSGISSEARYRLHPVPGGFDVQVEGGWSWSEPKAAFEHARELMEKAEGEVDWIEPMFDVEAPWIRQTERAVTRRAMPRPERRVRARGFGGGIPNLEKDWALRKLRAPASGGPTGAGIRIGHPDTGYTLHPSLFSWNEDLNRWLLDYGWDFVDGDGDAEDDLRDDLLRFDFPGHGTATASVLAARAGQVQGWSGLAPEARVVPLRVSESVVHLSYRRVIRAIHHAVDVGAHVISMSLGGPLRSRALELACRRAVDEGLVVVSAAGNIYPWVVYPAALPAVIAVAATNAADEPWSGSARGPAVDVAAPGEDVHCAGLDPDGGLPFVHRFSSGTSFATALTAGAASLWLQKHGVDTLRSRFPGARLQEAFRHLLGKTARIPAGWATHRYGGGIVDVGSLLGADLNDADAVTDVAPPVALARIQELRFDGLALADDVRTNLEARFQDADDLTLAELELRHAMDPSFEEEVGRAHEAGPQGSTKDELRQLAATLTANARVTIPTLSPSLPPPPQQAAAGSKTLRLTGEGRVRLQRPGGGVAVKTEVLAVTLESLKIRNLLSQDGSRPSDRDREGALTVVAGGVATTLSWATDGDGKLKNPKKFEDFVVFLGKHSGAVPIEIHCVELDKKNGFLKDLAKVIGTLGSIAGLIPGAGSAIAAGAGFVSATLDTVSKSENSDTELSYHGSLSDPHDDGKKSRLLQGTWILDRTDPSRPANEQRGSELRFFVQPLKRASSVKKVRLLLDEVRLDIPRRLLDKADAELIFELSAGCGQRLKQFSFKRRLRTSGRWLAETTGISDHVLYEGPYGYGIPYSLSAAIVWGDKHESLENVSGTVGPVIGEVTGLEDDETEQLTKALQSLRSLALEFSTDKVSLGTLSGVVCPWETVAGTRFAADDRPLFPMKPGERVKRPLSMGGGSRDDASCIILRLQEV